MGYVYLHVVEKGRFADDPEKQVPDDLLLSDDAIAFWISGWNCSWPRRANKMEANIHRKHVPAAGRLTERHALSKA